MELAPGLMPTVGVARPWSDPLLPFLPMPPIPPVEPVVRTASAMRELRAELKLIQERIPEDTCHVDLVDCDLFEWEVSLAGPDGTPYRGGTFHFLLRFPADYPIRNPSIQCMTPMCAPLPQPPHPQRQNNYTGDRQAVDGRHRVGTRRSLQCEANHATQELGTPIGCRGQCLIGWVELGCHVVFSISSIAFCMSSCFLAYLLAPWELEPQFPDPDCATASMVKNMRRHLLQLFTVVLGCAWLSTLTWWDRLGRPGDGGEHSGFVAVRQLGQDVRNASLPCAQGNETHADEEHAVEHGQQMDDHEQDEDLAHIYGQTWERDCSEIVESKKDYVSYAQGKNCIQSCGNLFAVRQFDSRIARIQAAIQGAVGKLVFKIPYVPQFLTLIFYMCLVVIFLAFLLRLAFSVSNYLGEDSDSDAEAPASSALFIVFLLFTLLAVLALAWCTTVIAVVVMGISDARAEDLGDVLESYRWAEAWVQPLAWMKNDYVPVLTIFYPPCILGLVLFGVKASQWPNEGTDLAFEPSTERAYYAARLGWMPSTTPYWVGIAYVAASVVHGLLERPTEVTPGSVPDPRKKFMWMISHTVLALGILVMKMGTLLLDILPDMAQSIMFFCRGQPFFGAINLLGIGIQLVMMFLAAARGVGTLSSCLTAALLQSDAMANFRSSWAAGMVLHEFYEKSFREAFGETYLSMSISIAAIFTMKFQYASDLQLIILSVLMSLHSIKSGVAEAREIISAEHEVAVGGSKVRFRIIPLNDYYARESYSKRRSEMTVSILRVSDTIEDEDGCCKISKPDSDSWLYTLMELANPGLIQASFNKDFVFIYMFKAIFVSAFWVVLAVSHFAFQNPIFDFGIVWHEAIQAVQSDSKTIWWQGAIKIMLICSPGVALLFMCLAVCVLRLERVRWADELSRANTACEREYYELKQGVESACATLVGKGLIEAPDFKAHLGCRKDSGGASLTNLICLKLMDSIFGPPGRLSLLKVWISPVEIQRLLEALDFDETRGWYLTQSVKTASLELQEDWTLRHGADLLAGRAKGMYGKAISQHTKVRVLVSQLLHRHALKSICLVFEGSYVSPLEMNMRDRFRDTREDAPSASALAEHLLILSDILGADLSSPLLKSICGPHKEKLENIKTCFEDLEEYCRASLTLHTKFDKPDGTARAYQSLEDEELKANESEVSAQDLIHLLKEAVAAAPNLSDFAVAAAPKEAVASGGVAAAAEEEDKKAGRSDANDLGSDVVLELRNAGFTSECGGISFAIRSAVAEKGIVPLGMVPFLAAAVVVLTLHASIDTGPIVMLVGAVGMCLPGVCFGVVHASIYRVYIEYRAWADTPLSPASLLAPTTNMTARLYSE
ncbi:unnamed protein product [Polarella glacialis]|uniref:UBC core domain-containing protein n=1 Tax=Polarella glacialis TaxID=89957 RepID=A0A813DUR6_POLGL|nr:unnamed protein product [Polarella glacialis]